MTTSRKDRAAGADPVLHLSHHGRHGPGHAGDVLVRHLAALAGSARDHPLVPVVDFLSFPAGFVAMLTGWYTAEVGRQPWVVYGLLRTADAVTPVAHDAATC